MIFNIEWARRKLLKPDSKQPFRTSIRRVQLTQNKTDLFRPHEDTALGPFRGTLTAAIVATASNPDCIVIETDEGCFEKVV